MGSWLIYRKVVVVLWDYVLRFRIVHTELPVLDLQVVFAAHKEVQEMRHVIFAFFKLDQKLSVIS